jgi:hypothetical protein
MGFLGKLLVAKEAEKIQNQNSKKFPTSFPFLLISAKIDALYGSCLVHY